MHRSIPSLIVLALLCTIALSAPTQPKKRSFKISRIRQRNFVRNGAVAIRKSYAKYGIQGNDVAPSLNIPTSLAPLDLATSSGSGSSSDNGDVSATPSQSDAEFLSPVSVGGQTLVMDFDTGSSDM
jgi:hypothetical protein